MYETYNGNGVGLVKKTRKYSKVPLAMESTNFEYFIQMKIWFFYLHKEEKKDENLHVCGKKSNLLFLFTIINEPFFLDFHMINKRKFSTRNHQY